MDLEKAYNKIDNLCCSNSSSNSNFFDAYKDTHDEDFCKDIPEMIEALETIKTVVDLQKEFGCPLEVVLKIQFRDICFVYDENGDKFFINGGGIFKSQFAAYHRTDLVFIDKMFRWKDYRRTWWLKPDRSE